MERNIDNATDTEMSRRTGRVDKNKCRLKNMRLRKEKDGENIENLRESREHL